MKIQDDIAQTLQLDVNNVCIGDKLNITYRTISCNYEVQDHFLNRDGCNNLILLAIYGEDYKYHVSYLYGYEVNIGDWPTYGHIRDLKKLLTDMQSVGAIITYI